MSRLNDPTMRVNRRQVLATTGSLGIAGLAGCTGGDGGDGGDGGGDGGGGDGGDGGVDYPTQDIRWIIPYSTGGGFDAYSRAIAEFMPSHLPNEVNIVPENLTGAAGRRAANEVYRAESDGYTIGIFNIPGFVAPQVTEGTEYDLTEYSWIGRVATNPHVLLVRAETEYETLSDLQQAEGLRFTSSGQGTIDYIAGVIGMNQMEIDVDIVTGYAGSTETQTAVVRGDGELTSTVYSSARTFVEDGELRPIIAFGENPPEYASDIPTVYDEGYDPLGSIIGLSRLVGSSPGVAGERISVLEEAFLATLESDEMQQWAEDAERPLAPAGADAAAEIASNAIETFEQFADQM